MRKSAMAEFPVAEFESRLAGLVKRLKENNLDGILISNRENTRYYCDLQSIIWSSKVSTPGILLLNTAGEMKLIGSASAVETARYTACCEPEDVTCYNRNFLPGIPGTYPEAIIDAMKQLGLLHGKIGMEFGRGCYLQLQLHWYEELLQKLPDVEFVDASSVIFDQRAVKSHLEIEALAHVCEQNEQSMRYAFEHIQPGVTTENGFFRLFAQEGFRRHCENVTNDLIPLSVLSGSERYAHIGCPPSNTVIQNTAHTPLQVTGSLYTKGYYGCVTRVGVVGSLSSAQKTLLSCARDTTAYALSLIHSGANVAAVTEAVDAFALASPGAAYYLSSNDLGFGIGLDLREPPYLQKLALHNGTLQTGMTLSISPRFGSPDTGLFALSQCIAVTETGIRRLSIDTGEPFII